MGKIRNIKLPNNETYDIYGKNVENIDWSDYEALPTSKTSNDVAYFIDNVPAEEMADENIGTFSGALATFDNAMALPMPSLKVSVEANQDLHGYDHPWVGGAGKNKLPLVLADIKTLNTSGTWSGNAYIYNGVTFTILTDSNGNVTGVSANGTATGNITFLLTDMHGSWMTDRTTYKINGSVGGSYNTWSIWVQGHGTYQSEMSLDGDGTFTYTAGGSTSARISIDSGVSLSNQMFRPMIRLATETDATFAPYSNICPISGWSEVNVSDVGANIWDEEWEVGTYNNTTGAKEANELIIRSKNYIRINPNTKYTTVAGFMELFFYDKNYTYLGNITNGGHNADIQPHEITSLTNAYYMTFRLASQYGATYNNNISINYPSSDTSYHAYQDKQYTLDFPQTVYGAEVDVVNGTSGNKLTHQLETISGGITTTDSSGKLFVVKDLSVPRINDYNTVTPYIISNYLTPYSVNDLRADAVFGLTQYGKRLYVRLGDEITTVEDANAYLASHNLQVKYELDTPTTFTTQPTLIKSLNGQNNLSVDCGDVIEGEYFKRSDKQIRLNDSVYGRSPEAIHAIYADNAEKATQDESGNNIKNTYANSFSISNHTITLKNKNGTSLGTVTVPDNNTTYTLSANTTNNKIALTPSSGTAQSITVPYATKAAQDESGNNIKTNYASSISISDHTITLKNKNNISLGTVTVPNDFVAPVESITTPTSLATFEASAMPMPSLKVSVEAKQDLHGYDKPWVGGAGKNKAMPYRTTNDSVVGIPYTVDRVDDNIVSYTLNGTATSSAAFLPFKMPVADSEKTYNVVYFENPVVQKFAWDTTDNVQISISDNITIPSNHVVYIGVYIYSGTVISNKKLKVMASESAITSFAPYSNECPISGWSEVNVSDVGKNKLPLVLADIKSANTTGTWSGNTYTISNATFTVNTDDGGNVVSIIGKGNGSAGNALSLPFTLSAGSYILSSGFDEMNGTNDTFLQSNGATIARGNSGSPGQSFTLSQDSSCNWLFRVMSMANYVCTPMIRLATDTDATFEPYVEPNLYTISLGQTVYGGEVDVVNGTSGNKITYGFIQGFTRGALDSSGKLYKLSPILDNVAMWTDTSKASEKIISNMFEVMSLRDARTATTPSLAQHETSFYVGGYVGDESTLDALLSNLQVKYELATPTTFTTQPTPIKSLNGINNLSVDSGDVMELHYVRPEYDEMTAKIAENAGTVLQKQLSDTSMHQILLSSNTTSNDGYYEVGKATNLYHQKYGSPGYGISTITLIDPNTTPANTLHAAELSVDEVNDTSLHLFKRVNTSSQMEGMTITTTDAILNGSTWDGINTSLKDAVSKINVVNVTNFDSTNKIVTLDRTYTEIETLLEDGHIVVIYFDYNNASLTEFRLRLFYHDSLRAMRFEEMPHLTPQSNTLNISFASIRQTLSGSTDTNQFIYDNTTYTIPLNT